MVKLVYCVRKRSDLDDEEFRDYWLNKHGPLVAKLAPGLNLKRYVQSHTMSLDLHEIIKATRGLKVHYDGLAELWWEDIDTFIDAYSSPEGMEADAACAMMRPSSSISLTPVSSSARNTRFTIASDDCFSLRRYRRGKGISRERVLPQVQILKTKRRRK
jgi:uncharacterized protein (TIGR02118 family)